MNWTWASMALAFTACKPLRDAQVASVGNEGVASTDGRLAAALAQVAGGGFRPQQIRLVREPLSMDEAMPELERFRDDVVLLGPSREQCEHVREHLLGSSVRNEASSPCGFSRDVRLGELTVPVIQGLVGRNWERKAETTPDGDVEYVGTAVATAYETLRLWRSPATESRFTVFFASQAELEERFNDASLFSIVSEAPLSEGGELFWGENAAKPGDLVTIMGSGLMHAAVVVAPGVVFEKVGAADNPHYRLALFSVLQKSWKTARKVVVKRRTEAALPDPWSAFRTRLVGDTPVHILADDAGGRHLFGMFRMPALHFSEGKAELPEALF